MSSFARTNTGDLDFTGHGLTVVTDVGQCAAWDIQDRFNLGLGEWQFDTSQGVPYLSFMGQKNPDIAAIRSLFRSIIESAQGVVSVQELSVVYNNRTRSLSYSFSALCSSGQTIIGGPGQPFVVTPVP